MGWIYFLFGLAVGCAATLVTLLMVAAKKK